MAFMNKVVIIVLSIVSSTIQTNFIKDWLLEYQAHKAYQSSNFSKANQDWTALLQQNPYDASLNYNIGLGLYQQKKYEEAEPYFKRAFEHGQNNSKLQQQALFNRGNVYVQQNKLPEAIDAYEKVLKMDPTDSAAKNNLEYAKQLQKQQEQKKDQDQQNNDQKNQNNKQDKQKSDKSKSDSKNNDEQQQDQDQKQNDQEQDEQKESQEKNKQQQNTKQDKEKKDQSENQNQDEKFQDQKDQKDSNKQSNQKEKNKNKEDKSDTKDQNSDKNKQDAKNKEQSKEDAAKPLEKSKKDTKNDAKTQEAQSGQAEAKEQQEQQQAQLDDAYATDMNQKPQNDDRLDKRAAMIVQKMNEQEKHVQKELLKLNAAKQGDLNHGQKNW